MTGANDRDRKPATAGNLISYLQMFDPESDVCFMAANPKKRLFFEVVGTILVTDEGFPVIGIELDGEEPFDKAAVKMAELCEAECGEEQNEHII